MPPRNRDRRRDRRQQPPRSFVDADKIAITMSKARKPHQTRFEHIRIITMPCDPTPGDLGKLYIDIHNHILEVASAKINHNVVFEEPQGGYPEGFDPVIDHDVPVTAPGTENCSYFVIQINGRPGEPVLQFAIRHDNLYCVGFRVLHPNEDAERKKWFSFGPIHLLKCTAFPVVVKSNYPEGYKQLEGLQFYPDLIRNVYSHFTAFEHQPITTAEGIVLKDSFSVVVCEGTRYWFAQKLAYAGMNPDLLERPTLTQLMQDLIQDWSSISIAILLLWLAEEEEKLRLDTPTREAALIELRKFEKYAGLITLRGPDDEIRLDLLSARSVFALLHQSSVVRKILIRKLNFDRTIPDRLADVDY